MSTDEYTGKALDYIASVKQGSLRVLRSPRGVRPMTPGYGVGVDEMLGMETSPNGVGRIAAAVVKGLAVGEPRANVQLVTPLQEAPGKLDLRVRATARGNAFEADTRSQGTARELWLEPAALWVADMAESAVRGAPQVAGDAIQGHAVLGANPWTVFVRHTVAPGFATVTLPGAHEFGGGLLDFDGTSYDYTSGEPAGLSDAELDALDLTDAREGAGPSFTYRMFVSFDGARALTVAVGEIAYSVTLPADTPLPGSGDIELDLGSVEHLGIWNRVLTPMERVGIAHESDRHG